MITADLWVLKVNNVQMKLKAFNILTVAAFITTGTFVSCVADNNSPGLEYMPDMYRSPAVEAYVDYGEVGGRYDEEAQEMVKNKFSYLPPVGTIPYNAGEMYLAPYNHGAPLGVDKTHGLYGMAEDTAGLAMARLDVNPVPYTQKTADEGKVLFERFCIHCHGEKGAGDGTVIKGAGGKYPVPNAYKKEMTAGEIVYIITYGRNAMGSHASQVSLEERWKLAHYVQKLAGNDKEIEEPLYFDAYTDTDGDGVVDSEDELPTIAGSKENNGSPSVNPEIQAVIDFADGNVVFDLGSTTLSQSSYASLDKVAGLLMADSTVNLAISGHTDNIGDASLNKAVSLERSRAAKAYLIEKGIDKTRIVAVGYGQYKPVANNETAEGRLANRRVEFRIYK